MFHIVEEGHAQAVENPVSRCSAKAASSGSRITRCCIVARRTRDAHRGQCGADSRGGWRRSSASCSCSGTPPSDAKRSDTEQAVLEREQEARREAEALSRSKDEFVATVSHELRTPLNAIFGWVRLLRSGSLNETQHAHALEVVERNTRAQAQLIEDLLDMSRVVTGHLRLDMRRVELPSVIHAAVDAVRPAAEAKELTVALDLDASVGPISGDPDRLQQIVWNLLTNSVKFTHEGRAHRCFAERRKARTPCCA